MQVKFTNRLLCLTFVLLPLILTTHISHASYADSTNVGTPLSAKNWFINDYAPLWKNNRSLQLDQVKNYYHAVGFMRQQGQLIQWQIPSSLEQLIAMVRDKGWQSSKVLSVQAQTLNPSSVALTVVWQSQYSDQSLVVSCEWYLADFEEEHWGFTQHNFIDCL
jgi:hypothetical protein